MKMLSEMKTLLGWVICGDVYEIEPLISTNGT